MELGNLESGMVLEGKEKSIKPYGAFIEIENGPVALAYIEDLSVARIKSPAERVVSIYGATSFAVEIRPKILPKRLES